LKGANEVGPIGGCHMSHLNKGGHAMGHEAADRELKRSN